MTVSQFSNAALCVGLLLDTLGVLRNLMCLLRYVTNMLLVRNGQIARLMAVAQAVVRLRLDRTRLMRQIMRLLLLLNLLYHSLRAVRMILMDLRRLLLMALSHVRQRPSGFPALSVLDVALGLAFCLSRESLPRSRVSTASDCLVY
jgi:succinate dehydrogenase/fumarate reductase cytochrome b subunit